LETGAFAWFRHFSALIVELSALQSGEMEKLEKLRDLWVA